jgi:hypothetical protein
MAACGTDTDPRAATFPNCYWRYIYLLPEEKESESVRRITRATSPNDDKKYSGMPTA